MSDFDLVYKNIFQSKKVVIFDIGANFVQSIKSFKNYLNIDNYYSCEPLAECYNFLQKNYFESNYHHYNLALGKNDEKKITGICVLLKEPNLLK